MKINYVVIDEALIKIGCTLSAADYHGRLCGLYCVGQIPEIGLGEFTPDFETPNADEAAETPTQSNVLSAFHEWVKKQLTDVQGGFDVLLPEGDFPLTVRLFAMHEWCAGFLFGLSSVDKKIQKGANDYEEEVQEFVQDVIEISRSEQYPEENEENEVAYMELCEYLRTGVQMMFMAWQTAE